MEIRKQLLLALFTAYYDARRNKRNTLNQLRFEIEYERNIFTLCDELLSGAYKVGRSVCFIVSKPVKREILAADFRDRVIHHLLFNCINPVLEQQFIDDSYSCRAGRGVHYGVRRMAEFMLQCSANYTRDCYVMKLDISGYFMSINRNILWDRLTEMLHDSAGQSLIAANKIPDGLIFSLLRQVVFNNPINNCIFRSRRDEWSDLPTSKSMFHASVDCGLPIGNLTSQLFSNVYLHEFDCFVKRELGFEYYGRYVDDFVLMHESKERLLQARDLIEQFLRERCQLKLHPANFSLQHYSKGFAFLGTYIKPGRIYIGRRTKNNFIQAVERCDAQETPESPAQTVATLNSYLGLLQHYNTYNLRRKYLLLKKPRRFFKYGYFKNGLKKFRVKRQKCKM
jgi:retron-type reverse transcriptase